MPTPQPDRTWHPNVRAMWDHAAAKPDAEPVTDGHGHTVFRVRGKTFLYLGDPDRPGISVKLSPGTRSQLIPDRAAGPKRYRLGGHQVGATHYIGQHGWVDVAVDDAQALEFALGLIDESYGQLAPRTRGAAAAKTAGRPAAKTASAPARKGARRPRSG